MQAQIGQSIFAATLFGSILASQMGQAAEPWERVVGTKDPDGETVTDVFGPDLRGFWSEHCLEKSKPGFALSFQTSSDHLVVSDGASSCGLVAVTDYNELERYYFVESENDCSKGAPGYLVSKFSYSYTEDKLLVFSKEGELSLTNCDQGKQD